jgi:hypothetical protein
LEAVAPLLCKAMLVHFWVLVTGATRLCVNDTLVVSLALL